MTDKPHFRSSPRPHIACKVTLYRPGWSSDSPIVAFTEDLSTGGLFAVTDEKLELGQRVEIVLSTPSTWEPLVLNAEVCRQKVRIDDDPGGVGLRFVDLTDIQVLALDDFMASLNFES